jgi:glucokinase
MILAGDVGGTNSRLALFSGTPSRPVAEVIEIFPSSAHDTFRHIVRRFRATHDQLINAACFGVAGPVRHGKALLPNLDWPEISAAELEHDLGVPVRLANDLEVNAYGIAALTPEDLFPLNAGDSHPHGNRVLISAGTGLGEAGLLFIDGAHQPWACEGGHCDFAPRNETEIALLKYLLQQFDHVSYERVLSGPGLVNIYKFLRDTKREEEPHWLADRLATGDPGAIISELALNNESPLCWQALDIFTAVYGAEAGNLALKGMATGGVYIGGGIAPKILKKLTANVFLPAFTEKGRSADLMKAMPIHVILNDKTALLGAGRLAMLTLQSN